MARTIIRLERGDDVRYMEWSSIVDAPGTYLVPIEGFRDYYAQQYGRDGVRGLQARLDRADERGTSSFHDRNLDEAIGFNRAGPLETVATAAQIFELYRVERPRRETALTPAEVAVLEAATKIRAELDADDPAPALVLAEAVGCTVVYLFDLEHARFRTTDTGGGEVGY